MAVEVERKFLVRGDDWRGEIVRTWSLSQAYLSTDKRRTVRVRLAAEVTQPDQPRGYLTVKGKRVGDSRPEFEYEIPEVDARFMLDHLCLAEPVVKVRHLLGRSPGVWTVDEFGGGNHGLVLAELEWPGERQSATLPAWLGLDVTEDDRFANSYLQEHPFTAWAETG
jgi:adenylate cyclase